MNPAVDHYLSIGVDTVLAIKERTTNSDNREDPGLRLVSRPRQPDDTGFNELNPTASGAGMLQSAPSTCQSEAADLSGRVGQL